MSAGRVGVPGQTRLLARLAEAGASRVRPRLPLRPPRSHASSSTPPLPASSGKLVIKDQDEAIVLRTRHILVDNGGELHAGSALCPYQGNFSIVLYGRWAVSFRGSNAPLGSDGKEAFQRREGGGMAGRGPWSQPAGRNHEQHRRGPLGRAGGGVVFLVGPRRGDARPCQTSGCLSVTSRLREPLGVFIQRVRMDTIKQISTQCRPLAN